MAKFEIVAVRDVIADAFLKPIFVQSKGAAIRSFTDAVNDPQSDFCKHSDDYIMYHFGSWTEDGEFAILDKPQQLARGTDLKVNS